MKISVDRVRELRAQSGAGIMDCRNALVEVAGDTEQALQLLKERSLVKVEKKKNRATSQGLVEAYIHAGGRIGALVEVNCETDFVARTDEFRELAHNLAMQVAAIPPQFISPEEAPKGNELDPQTDCLLQQAYIKDPALSVQDIINQTIARFGENIKVSRFSRFELGE